MGNFLKRLFFYLFIPCVAWAEVQSDSVQVAPNIYRRYQLFLPASGELKGSIPVIFAFHGSGDSALQFANKTKLHDEANPRGMAVVYPESLGREWMDGSEKKKMATSDLLFVDALIKDLELRYHLDPARVFLTGFSNGGVFVYRLACERPNRWAGIAVVSAGIAIPVVENCQASKPLSVLEIWGTKDRVIPYLGGKSWFGQSGPVLAGIQTIQFFSSLANCDGLIGDTIDKVNDGTKINRYTFTKCSGVSVVHDAIVNGGHNWPMGSGKSFGLGWLLGRSSREMVASQRIVDFFESNFP